MSSSGTPSTGLRCSGRTWTRASRTLGCPMLIWFNCTTPSRWSLPRTKSELLELSARTVFGETIEPAETAHVQKQYVIPDKGSHLIRCVAEEPSPPFSRRVVDMWFVVGHPRFQNLGSASCQWRCSPRRSGYSQANVEGGKCLHGD